MSERKAVSVSAKKSVNRRHFLKGAAAAAGVFTIVPRYVLGGEGNIAPSEKINIAIIGTGGQGLINMKQLFDEPDARIAALCDVNEESDYSKFYYGGTAGLKPATELVRQKYGQACPTYRDYNQMFEKEDIDAVLVATPDHTHAMIALAVLNRKKHLYCEKPLCRTIQETRLITEAARKAGVATQMGNFGHSSEDIRLCCEWIWDGAIGDVTEVHSWIDTGSRFWTDLTDKPKDTPPVPAGFDWERWLQPVPARPYHPDYAPVSWRAWWQFGSGNIGDYACHHLDPAFWALKLDQCETFSVEASTSGNTAEICPAASLVYFDMPKRGDMGPVRITWYEGGIKPALPREIATNRKLGDHGVLFIGTKGMILGDGWSKSPRIIPEDKMKAYKKPPKTLPRVKGHHRNWLDACKGEGKPSTHFDYGGPLTEFVLMGNVAIRAGKRLDFDWKNLKVTNDEAANEFLKPNYREGFTL
ncbi:MAG TPA: Gfo/Idh/MocA family oxidoreductase [Candidatus Sumerlaeota bacterium]|nr:Gfo/Idh/MocA family oxidoreductase [Candidatus Sumerlaeota bacterium]